MRIKDWNKFQHFKDRRPPWIKLYRELLDDPDWHELDPASAKVLVMIWLIASEEMGELPTFKKLAFRLRMSEKQVEMHCSRLSHWLIQDDINLISERYQHDAPETEERREEAESSGEFFKFWEAWPKNDRKQDKKKCMAKWQTDKLDAEAEKILADVRDKKLTKKWADGYIEAPLVYLNNRRWEDGVTQELQEQDQWSTRGGVEKIAASIGIAPWNEMERWDVYVRRVKTSFDGAAK